ncbi:hypothetical protein CTAM01_02601 [Colletotrichum tamarilloi]|uniref:Uncharacterized protein n=1 Tax=Colletotrichum tamarilloi TaxID=1209934 RepID=A0ABQ9RLW9_9PEZI|nr:uncharacterized protein CTAM01_02601 [Colletotrichum tamarilloi]KAK1507489.1 hypothetical protein CTAM01_02601 [Colletotrichum tamarilloi]
MAASGQHAVGEVCYSPGLNVFNDGLNYADSPPRSMIIQVSAFQDRVVSQLNAMPAIRWLDLEDSWRLPRPNEVYTGGQKDHLSGLWIGWFLPDFQILDDCHPHSSRWPSLPPKQCVNNLTTHPSPRPFIRKAFKVVYKPGREGDTKFFALCTPDANGICQAKVVPEGARNIFFFKEWRDDAVRGSWARQRTWTTNAKAGASRIYSMINAATNQPVHSQQHTSESEYEDCLEEEDEDDDDGEDEESEYAESEIEGSGSEEENSEEDFEQERLLESLRPSPPEFASYLESESGSSDEDEYHSNGQASRRGSHRTPKQDIKATISARIASEPRSNLRRRPASSRRSIHVSHNLLSRRNTNRPGPADTLVGNVATNLKRSQSPMQSLSSKSEKKRRINLQVESPPDSTPKRHAPLGVDEPLTSRPKRAPQPASRTFIKNEDTQDSDDEIQFIKEVPTQRPQQMTTKVEAFTVASSETSITYISKFVAAGKLLQLARLPDTFSRKVMLESFSKHLKSTNLAQFDALVKNIVDSAEEGVRVMIAETLQEQLKDRLPVVSGA